MPTADKTIALLILGAALGLALSALLMTWAGSSPDLQDDQYPELYPPSPSVYPRLLGEWSLR